MKSLPNLFKLLELTRSQVQYGYVLSGVRKHELSNLAEHHYLVAFMAWQIAEYLNEAGAKLDIKKVLQVSLIHDLAELFGGDISRPYAMANPKARELAKAFEKENQNFLRKYLDKIDKELWEEALNPVSDEAIVFKIADIIECAHFLKYIGLYNEFDTNILKEKLPEVVEKINDDKTKTESKKFIEIWLKEIQGQNATEILFEN